MDRWIRRPHMVRTTNIADVMLRRSGRIKAGLEERMQILYFVKEKITEAMISRCCGLTEL